MDHNKDTEVEAIKISGFDPLGEPEIRKMESGCIWLVFNFMPPSWIPEEEYKHLGRCKNFDRELEQSIGTLVHWDDREFFLIEKPMPDTINRIQQFLANYRAQHDSQRDPQ